ncbi:MAG: hypothetical protein D6702_06270 [Planctomycetota bacterium]|nr:MAG: hypothetical protein D6702_06270 [Planctomycetota bacterium]
MSLPLQLLRLAVAVSFLGHGLLALANDPGHLALVTGLGCAEPLARRVLVVIGAFDVGLAVLVLLRPWRPVLLLAALGALLAAAAWPLSGLTGPGGFLARFPDWVAPLVLWLLLGRRSPRWR